MMSERFFLNCWILFFISLSLICIAQPTIIFISPPSFKDRKTTVLLKMLDKHGFTDYFGLIKEEENGSIRYSLLAWMNNTEKIAAFNPVDFRTEVYAAGFKGSINTSGSNRTYTARLEVYITDPGWHPKVPLPNMGGSSQ